MKKKWKLLPLLALALLITGCKGNQAADQITSSSQLNDSKYKVGIPSGTAAATVANKYYTDAEIVEYNSLADGYMAVEYGKIDAFAFDTHVLNYIVAGNDKLALVDDSIGEEQICIGAAFGKEKLINQVNQFIEKYRSDGTYDDMYDRWLNQSDMTMPEIAPAKNPKDKIIIGTEGYAEPMNFYGDNGEVTGFDIEFAKRLGQYLGVAIEIRPMNFNALIPSAMSGKIDLLISNLNATPERKEQMLLSDTYIDSAIGMIVSADRVDAPEFTDSVTGLQKYMTDKSIGVITGSLYEQTAKEFFKTSKTEEFNTASDALAALKAKKIDSSICNTFAAIEIARQNPDLYVSKTELKSFDCGFALDLNNKKLQKEINETISGLKESGKYEELFDKWINWDESTWKMPTEKLTGKNGIMRVATNSNSVPFSMMVNGEQMGFDLEILYWAAYEHDYKMEIQTMDFAGLIPAIASGKADVASGTIVITPERAEQVLFTDPYVQNGHKLVLLKKTSSSVGFWKKVAMSFEKNFIRENRWKMVVSGIKITILISVCAILLGSIIGFGICMLRRSRNKVLSGLAKVYIRILQGTPILVFLMILYYILFADIDMSAIIVAVIAFALNFGAYASETMRTGIEAVDIGQREAAYAMGVGKVETFLKIVFPQAAKNFMPVYKGEVISLVKSTSIVGYIAIQDLTKASDIIRSRTYEAFFPLITTAVIYFMIAYLLTIVLNLVEIKIDPRRRKRRGGVGK